MTIDAMTSLDLIGALVDKSSFTPWDEQMPQVEDRVSFPGYSEQLRRATKKSRASESVRTGEGLVSGKRVALIAGEFHFMGGSMGLVAAERVRMAFERARYNRQPLIALTSSGGVRIQEGTPAFVRMAALASAVRRFVAEHLPYIVYLAHPTLGGVLSSYASLGQFVYGMPGALIGFSGPRVLQRLGGDPVPSKVQSAEHLMAMGFIDGVIPASDLAAHIRRILSVLYHPRDTLAPPRSSNQDALRGSQTENEEPWRAVVESRRPSRPELTTILSFIPSFTEIRGDRVGGGNDPAILAGVGLIGGIPAVVAGHDRTASPQGALVSPAGLRKARRAMDLAEQLALPLVTMIDTSGPAPGRLSEEHGMAWEVAMCLSRLSALPVPTVSILLGEGAGGTALALLPADCVIAAEWSWLAPIAPEVGSDIIYRSGRHARAVANAQHVASWELKTFGIVDQVVKQGGNRAGFVEELVLLLTRQLNTLIKEDSEQRLGRRTERIDSLGLGVDQ